MCLKRKKKNGVCFPIGVIYPPSERGRGGAALLFCFALFPSPLETSLSERRPPRSTPASATGGKWQRGKKTGERGAESACLSGLMMQSARNTPPHPPPILPKSPSLPPPAPGDDITSRRSNMAGNTCRAACGRWKFFPTAVALLQAVAPATR